MTGHASGPGIYTHAVSCPHRLVNSVVYQLEGLLEDPPGPRAGQEVLKGARPQSGVPNG